MTLYDNNAAPCLFHTVKDGRLVPCRSTRASYSCINRQATVCCLDCRGLHRRDVAYDVPLKVKTVEQWRTWWSLVQ